MPEKQLAKAVKDFKSAALNLRTLLKNNCSLSDSEQLGIENCILMLQIEYGQWRKAKLESDVGRLKGYVEK
jgi:hypothetical protein